MSMDYCVWLRVVSGIMPVLRKLETADRIRRIAIPAPDGGVTPVVVVVMLISMVAVAGVIIGLTMFMALEDTSGTLSDVWFQASADEVSLYHAGGMCCS